MIDIRNLSVRLPGFSLKEVNFSIESGEFFCLLGPTGSGKTLILESIVGIIPISGGRIVVSGRDVSRLPPEQRDIGIVYQDCALFPHLNVEANIRYGLRYHNGGNVEGRERCNDLIARLNLTHLLRRSVTTLSGGEKQRVALARALATAPTILLLDEPLAALDPCFREEIRDLFRNFHQETGLTVLMVTHDFTDAHSLAQRVAILNNGSIEQIGSMEEVFHRPATKVVADFVGIKNVLPARVDHGMLRIGDMTFSLPGENGASRFAAIRPERIRVQPDTAGMTPDKGFSGQITTVSNQGLVTELTVVVSGIRLRSVMLTSTYLELNLQKGSAVSVSVKPCDIHLI